MPLTTGDGEQLKIGGLEAAEWADSAWVATMREAAITISNTRGMVSTDDLRHECERLNCFPIHQNSWGTIFRGAEWKEVGRKKSEIPSNHHREIRVWRWEP